jgi:glycosyltransferase involved in cell wall biosynthesis
MRVVHMINSYDQVSGVETHVLTLAAAQGKRGSSPMLISDRYGYLADACDSCGIPVAVEQGLNPRDRAAWPPPEAAIRSLVGTLTAFGADVIHCHSVPAASQAMFAGDLLRIPCVFTDHNAGDMEQGAAEFLSMRFTIISCSKTGFDLLKQRGTPEASLRYIPNGTVPISPDQARPSSGQPDLILVGSMSERKGVDVAILAMHKLSERHGSGSPTLNIYGTGPQAPYFREMAAVLELDEIVRFHGSQIGILELCPADNILVLPSRAEASPMVILEAMSRGMPIVATDVGDVPEMLPDSRYGRIVPVDSIEALADAVDWLLSDISDGRFDPEPVIARHRSLYSADKMAERIDQVYSEAVARGAGAGFPAGALRSSS